MLTFAKSMYSFWCNWKAIPVISWIKAAGEFQSGNFSKAISLYRTGLLRHAFHPAAPSAMLDLAYCQVQRNDLKGAIETLKSLVATSPTNREATIRLHGLLHDIGLDKDAAWVLRRYLRNVGLDKELIARMIVTLLAFNATDLMLSEPLQMLEQCPTDSATAIGKLGAVLLSLRKGDSNSRQELWKLAGSAEACKETLLCYADILLKEGKIALARQTLRRVHGSDRNCCRTLVMFAKSYLASGPFYSPEDARQLAEQACIASGWASLPAVHILAESYHHLEDTTNALLVAYKGKDLMRSNSPNNDEGTLVEQLIQNLSESH